MFQIWFFVEDRYNKVLKLRQSFLKGPAFILLDISYNVEKNSFFKYGLFLFIFLLINFQ